MSKDVKKAFHYFSLAAAQSYAPAMNNLGFMLRSPLRRQSCCSSASLFRHGIGTEKDEEQAVDWFQKAAEQGDVAAKDNLMVMLQEHGLLNGNGDGGGEGASGDDSSSKYNDDSQVPIPPDEKKVPGL